jgi:hypothetical protein
VDSLNPNYASVDGVLLNKSLTTLITCPGGLLSITIPSGVTSIGDYAFYGCSGLTSIKFTGNRFPTVSSGAFPTSNLGFTFKKRVGATGFAADAKPELQIKSISFDDSGKLSVQTDALVTSGLKLLYAPDLNSPFTEVTGSAAAGTGGIEVSSGASATQGAKGFYKVVYQ